ncbi:MAG: hypothetical protein ACRDTH_18070 [Pseudonocardiaceae bacterium]
MDCTPGHGAVTAPPLLSTYPQHVRRIGTMTAPTNSPGPPSTSSPPMAPTTPYIVVLTGG